MPMKVFKNLFGNNSKISWEEIAGKDTSNKAKTLDKLIPKIETYFTNVASNTQSVIKIGDLQITLGREPIKISAGANTDTQVTYKEEFGSNAFVFLQMSNSTTNKNYKDVVNKPVSMTSTGFTIQSVNASTGGVEPTISWLAIGKVKT